MKFTRLRIGKRLGYGKRDCGEWKKYPSAAFRR